MPAEPIVRPLLLVMTLAAVAATPTPSVAQASGSKALEEIIVTSRRREETLQDVPIAVTAYSGEYLESVGAIDITALAQSTPNTTLEVSRATNTTLTAYIRGVGQQDPVAGFEGGVGIYLDDVYLARPQGTVFDVYDVERIEVLRGPQGTLYGRNTIGGAVRYVTRRLANEPELEVKASLGSYRQADLVLTGSTPVSDSFRVGGTAATFNRDGFGTNLYTGEENADKQILAFRASAEWEPTDDWLIRLFADYSDDGSSPRQGHRLLPSTGGYPVLPDVFDTRAGITTIPTSNAGLTQKVTQGGIALTAEWQLNDLWTAKSITSYREDDTDSLIDFDNLPEDTFDAPVEYKNHQFTQEFQANYTGDRWSGVFGLYYLDGNAFDAFDVVLGGAGVTAFTLGDYDTKAWAGYADVSWNLTDTVALSVGGRYTSDERTATVSRETFLGLGSPYFGNASAVSITVPVPGAVPTFHGNRTDKDFTPRASVSWQPVDAHNLYLSYTEGFKGGGFDPRGAYQFPEVQAGFEPEEVKSWEVGAKSRWGDGSVQTNVAVFVADYTNVQVPGSILLDNDGDGMADGFAGSTTNAGKADMSGAEFEMLAQITDAFSTQVAIGYIDAKYTEWLVGSTDANGNPIFVDIADQRVFQNTPEWSGNVMLRYNFPLDMFGNPGTLGAIVQASYKDDTYQFEIPNPLTNQDAYTLVDLGFVWTTNDGRYQVGLHGRNLTDKEYIVANYDFAAVDNSVIGFYGPPRTITGSFAVRF